MPDPGQKTLLINSLEDLQIIQKKQKWLHSILCCTLILSASVQLFIYLPLLGFCFFFFLLSSSLTSTLSSISFEIEDKNCFHIAKIQPGELKCQGFFSTYQQKAPHGSSTQIVLLIEKMDWQSSDEKFFSFLLTQLVFGTDKNQLQTGQQILRGWRALKC